MITITIALMTASASFYLPDNLLESVCFVESSNRPHAIHKDDGSQDSVGLCQLHLSTARQMGFKGSAKSLLRADVNAFYAAKYLSYQINRYNGSIHKAISAYNAGTYRENSRGIARNQAYVDKVFNQYDQRNRHNYLEDRFKK